MASGSRRGGGDRILESRHLVGLFLGVVLLCGVFFTLGYVMGHNQFGSVHAESTSFFRPVSHAVTPAVDSVPAEDNAASDAGTAKGSPVEGWDFYPKQGDKHSQPSAPSQVVEEIPPAPIVSTHAPAPAPVLTPVKSHAPATLRNAKIVLQVAALRHQADALAMAQQLQKKRFPSFVSAPANGDALYHVQVGPYPDERSAEAAKSALDHAGFKAILKR